MGKKPIDQLGDLQREVLELLWKTGGGTVGDMVIQLAGSGRKLAYTTVLTTLQNLERAGWARHRKQGRAYVYRAAKSKSNAGASSIRSFITRAFDGDPHLMFQTFINDQNMSEQDLIRLRKMIEKKRREMGPGGKQ